MILRMKTDSIRRVVELRCRCVVTAVCVADVTTQSFSG